MTSAKIRIKVGSMELEYEGDPSFLTGGIETLLTTMGDLAARGPEDATWPETVVQVPPVNGNAGGNGAPVDSGQFSFTTSTIAAHLGVKTGPELVICAIAQIELVQRRPSSNRTEILAEMKSATTYYNENMRSNMTKILSGLTRNKRINQVGKDTYALSAAERKQVEAKFAEIG